MGVKTHHWQVHNKEIGKTSIECEICGEKFKVFDNKSNKSKYCSEECQYKSYRDRATVECAVCGEEKEVINCRTETTDNFFCSYSCQGEWMSKNKSGKDNPCWKEETFNIPYGRKYKDNRKKCLKKYENSCVVCRVEENVEVHHIYPRRKAYEEFGTVPDWVNDLDNLVALCTSHHNEFEGKFVEQNASKFIKSVQEESS
jgi:ribosomal protein S14